MCKVIKKNVQEFENVWKLCKNFKNHKMYDN